ncbi:MAG: InlB B-repeat-containing protein, partial [Bacillota bacterium]
MKKKMFTYFVILLSILLVLSACDNNNQVKYTLTISSEGEGTVNPEVGEHEIVENTVVTLTAEPADNYTFAGW